MGRAMENLVVKLNPEAQRIFMYGIFSVYAKRRKQEHIIT